MTTEILASLQNPAPNAAAYSVWPYWPDHQIGCLYERGERNASEKIAFARFPFSWVEEHQ